MNPPLDPHSPYLPPEPFHRMFYNGDEFNPKDKSLEPVYEFKPFRDYFLTWFLPGYTDKDYIIAQYDAEIAYMDSCITNILAKLEALGIEDGTLVVFTSDHGETLYDHDCYFDHHGLYECTLEVPLILSWDGHLPQGKRFKGIFQAKDSFPTISSSGENFSTAKWHAVLNYYHLRFLSYKNHTCQLNPENPSDLLAV